MLQTGWQATNFNIESVSLVSFFRAFPRLCHDAKFRWLQFWQVMSLEKFPRLRAASDIRRSHGSFKFSVKTGKGDVLVENDPFCRIHHVAICRPDGSPIYDMPARAEPRGAISLAIDRNCKVALIEQWRPVPASAPFHRTYPDPELGSHGFLSLEIPRGFPEQHETAGQAARREAEEELSCSVLSVRPLGWTNFNTSFMLSDIPIFAVLVEPTRRVESHEEEGEFIHEVSWWTLDALQEKVSCGEIRCGVTLASLAYLFAERTLLERLAVDYPVAFGVDMLLGNTRNFIENVMNELWEVGVDKNSFTAEMLSHFASKAEHDALSGRMMAYATRGNYSVLTENSDSVWELHTPMIVDSLWVRLVSFQDFASVDQQNKPQRSGLGRLDLRSSKSISEVLRPIHEQNIVTITLKEETDVVFLKLRTGLVRIRHSS